MLTFLPERLKGTLILILVILNTIFWTPILIIGAFLKLLVPLPLIKRVATKVLIASATNWVSLNSFFMTIFLKTEFDVTDIDDISMDDWYFVNCNHQSWSDIPITQKVLNRRIPMLKFFLKKELIWVPIIGICWWALDFPFMKRYSVDQVRKNPQLAGKDLATTRKACEKFKTTPVSVFNFLEGTRFTQEKHDKQQSPFTNLLKPKAGGAAFVLGSMGEQMHTMLDITLVYSDKQIGPWDLFCGRINKVVVHFNKIEIPKEFLGKDYSSDPEFKANFQVWLNDTWSDKDMLISQLKAKHGFS